MAVRLLVRRALSTNSSGRHIAAASFCTNAPPAAATETTSSSAQSSPSPFAPPPEPRFPHPVSLVNGASRGLGLALTRLLLKTHPHWPLVATCRSPETAKDLTALKEEFSSQLSILRLDVTQEDTIKAVADEISEKFGRLDLCLTSVGVLHIPDEMEPEPKLVDVTPENLLRCYRVNAVGPMMVAKHVLPLLKIGQGKGSERGGAVVANITCKMGSMRDNQLGGWYSYRASKASLNMFTRNLGIECKRRREPVIAVVINPGVVDTELSKLYRRGMPPEKLFTPEYAAEKVVEIIDSLNPEDSAKFFHFDSRKSLGRNLGKYLNFQQFVINTEPGNFGE